MHLLIFHLQLIVWCKFCSIDQLHRWLWSFQMGNSIILFIRKKEHDRLPLNTNLFFFSFFDIGISSWSIKFMLHFCLVIALLYYQWAAVLDWCCSEEEIFSCIPVSLFSFMFYDLCCSARGEWRFYARRKMSQLKSVLKLWREAATWCLF